MRAKLVPLLLLLTGVMATLLVVNLTVLPPATAVAQDPDPQIVGGREAEPGAWPWQVAILEANNPSLYDAQFCGGSLLSRLWVITAAHCVDNRNPAEVDVATGVHNLVYAEPGHQRIAAAEIIVHPDYDPNYLENDIALIRLAEAVRDTTAEGELPVMAITAVGADAPPLDGILATVTGWGSRETTLADYPEALHEVNLPILDNQTCSQAYSNLPNTMLCAGYMNKGGKDACGGDSGGPLVIFDETAETWLLAGLVSWGYGCGYPGYPGVYTRVSSYSDWLNDYLSQPPVIFNKTVSDPVIAAGGTLTYTLSLTNIGSNTLNDIAITDAIPPNTTYIDGSVTNGGTLTDGILQWSPLTLESDVIWSAQFAVEVDPTLADTINDDIETPREHWSTARDESSGEGEWTVSDLRSYSGTYAWHGPNTNYNSDLYLILTVPEPLSPSTTLSFWHTFDIEYGYDAAVVEISTNAGDTWTDLGDYFTVNGYNGYAYLNTENPLSGQAAFSGYQPNFRESRVNLSQFAGEMVQIRFRIASDYVFGYAGWFVDDVVLETSIANQAFMGDYGSNTAVTSLGFVPTAFRYLPFTAVPD